jgi:hypothetical protein
MKGFQIKQNYFTKKDLENVRKHWVLETDKLKMN